MHLLLTDHLSCPRCGPEFGLILLAERIAGRRVLEGRLGCANCRAQYPVRGGEADLRAPSAAPSPEPAPPENRPEAPADPAEAAVRLAALLGLAEAQGMVLVVGPGAELAPALASLVPGAEFVALRDAPAGGEETPGASRVASSGGLPFHGRFLRGAAFTGGASAERLEAALRLLAPGARVLVEGADAGTAEALRRGGAETLLEQEGAVLARVPGPGAAG